MNKIWAWIKLVFDCPKGEYWGRRKAVGRRNVSTHVSAALILKMSKSE